MANLNNDVPGWIYSLADYCQMFDLNSDDREKSIFDFPGGISSFNTEMHVLGHRVVSADQAYSLLPNEIAVYAEEVFIKNEEFLQAHLHTLRSNHPEDLQQIFRMWQHNKDQFIMDYSQGLSEGRYQSIESINFPYKNHQFSLALCSDFLFHSQLNPGFNANELINELCRIATEVRIFPLLDQHGEISLQLGPVMLFLQEQNFQIEIKEVSYYLRQGGNAMLRVKANECPVESARAL